MNNNGVCQWLYYEINYYIRGRWNALRGNEIPQKYAGRKVMTLENTNEMLYRKIIEGNPFWAGRIGGNEMNTIAYYMRERLFPFRTDARKDVLHDLYFGAGFFPEDLKCGERFVNLMLDYVKDIDLIGVWNRYMEEWMLAEYAPNASVSYITHLQPWGVVDLENNVVPWTSALKGKKVLVIHPFEESIKKQYFNNRTLIFKDLPLQDDLLPEFDLKTLKAVQTMGNNEAEFPDWFAALKYMVDECRKIDFDVAIIGCGAYGFPLASEIKKMRKIAIHLGGVTQLLFGIRGKRWDQYSGIYKKMINEHWVRPLDKERIKDSDKVEGACYW